MRAFVLALASLILSVPAAAQEVDPFDDGFLHTIEVTFHQAGWWNQLTNNYPGDTYIPADISFDGGAPIVDIGVRLRGEASYFCATNKKKPFRLQMDAFVDGQKVGEYDTLRLNNGAGDPTFLREALMSKTLGKYVPMAKRAFVWMEINGKPWGVYIIEQQKDGQWAEEMFGTKEAHRYKAVWPNALDWVGAGNNKYESKYLLVNPGAAPDPHTDLVDAIDRLNNGPLATLVEDLDPVLDVDSALWHFAGENAFGNMDSYIGNSHNYYVVGDGIHDRLAFQSHDLDLSFGTWNSFQPTYPINYDFNSGGRPLSNRLWDAPGVREVYRHHLKTLIEDEFSWETGIGVLARRYHRMIDAAVLADPKKLYTYEQFVQGLTDDISGGNCWSIFRGLKRWATGRRAYVLSHGAIAKPRVVLDVRHTPARPDPGDAVTIVATVLGGPTPEWVELRHRELGAFQRTRMRDDGLHGDGAAGDGIWGMTLPALAPGARVEYVVVAEALGSGALAFFPTKGEQHPYHLAASFGAEGVRITEVLYSGADGEFVELTNTSAGSIDLTGWSLDDASATAGSVDLSAFGVLAPGASVLITDESAASFAAAWGLSTTQVLGGNAVAKFGRNDGVHLFDGLGLLADRLVYGDEDFPGSVRAKDDSAWVCMDGVGRDDAYALTSSDAGDPQGSWVSSGGDVGSPGQWFAAGCPDVGAGECSAVPNSTGLAAGLVASGSAVVAHNDLHLLATNLPVGQLGFLMASPNAGGAPGFAGGKGWGCVGVPRWRFDQDTFVTDASGTVLLQPNFQHLPDGMAVLPGETWRFQVWFRDDDPTPTSNTSDGVAVTLR